MSIVWDKMRACAKEIQDKFAATGTEYINKEHEEKYNWENHIFFAETYRRAHIEIVDKTESHGIYILHATVFPHENDDSPIWGFDTVCGKNKITGAFHDFSLVSDQHPMHDWFANEVKDISWNKKRELPEWARNIFSPAMVAAGNISDPNEIDQFVNLGLRTLDYYIRTVNRKGTVNSKDRQNYYCQNQKKNPHVYRSMIAMGVPEAVINDFVEEILFPEIGK